MNLKSRKYGFYSLIIDPHHVLFRYDKQDRDAE